MDFFRLSVLIAAIALAGCKTTEQRIAEDDAKCLTYGVQKGSQPYVNCRMALEQQRSDRKQISQTGFFGMFED